jgi:hypothetical protein
VERFHASKKLGDVLQGSVTTSRVTKAGQASAKGPDEAGATTKSREAL